MKKFLSIGLALVVYVSTIAQTYPEQAVINNDTKVIGQGAQSALNNNIVLATAGSGAYDVMPFGLPNLRSFGVQIIGSAGISSGQIIFEQSMDNVSWSVIPVFEGSVFTSASLITAATSIAANTNRFFQGNLIYQYFRIRISTGFVGGTVQAITRFSIYPYEPAVSVVSQLTAANILTSAVQSGTWTVQPGNTANTTAWLMEPRTGTTNGTTTSTLNSAATTNATNLKASAGMIYNVTVMNASAATKYIRIYNKATAPTVGTDIPILVIAVPASSSKELTFNYGIKLSTGIGYAITNAAGATDATAIAAGDVQLLVNWQ